MKKAINFPSERKQDEKTLNESFPSNLICVNQVNNVKAVYSFEHESTGSEGGGLKTG